MLASWIKMGTGLHILDNMDESLYSRRSNLVIGFHGCDRSVVEKVIVGKTELIASTNDYDWLGSGIYFWENNEERAWQWAKELSKRSNSSIKTPAVIGAVIDLGYCFDLCLYLKFMAHVPLCNYSAPPMGMSNRLTVVLQQELH